MAVDRWKSFERNGQVRPQMMPVALRQIYFEERAAAVIEALRAGKTRREILGNGRVDRSGKYPKTLRLPSIWTHDSIKAWKSSHPEWAAEFDELAERNRKAADIKKGGAKRAQTHCHRGHPLSGSNLRLEARKEGGHYRRCVTCLYANLKNPPMPSEDLVRTAVEAIQSGLTIHAITKPGSSNYILSHRKLGVVRKANPKFDRLLLKLSAKNAGPRWLAVMQQRRKLVAAPALSHNMSALDVITAAMPRWLAAADRQDIIADMWMAIAEDRLKVADIGRRVPEFVSQHQKKYDRASKFGPRSLDDPIGEGDGMTFGQMLREDQAMWR